MLHNYGVNHISFLLTGPLWTDENGFLDFLTWTENQRYDFDSPPKKDKKLNRKNEKRCQEFRMLDEFRC
jgi:hypothetical protein